MTMCDTYIDAFKNLQQGKIEACEISIENKEVKLREANVFEGYNVKDLSVK